MGFPFVITPGRKLSPHVKRVRLLGLSGGRERSLTVGQICSPMKELPTFQQQRTSESPPDICPREICPRNQREYTRL